MRVQNAVSWTSAPVSYFIHTIGRRRDVPKKAEEVSEQPSEEEECKKEAEVAK